MASKQAQAGWRRRVEFSHAACLECLIHTDRRQRVSAALTASQPDQQHAPHWLMAAPAVAALARAHPNPRAALHLRRQAMAKLGPMHGTGVYDKAGDLVEGGNDTVLKKLFNVLGARFVDRPGGYTRVLKLTYRRLGDAGETAVIELMKEGEVKTKVKGSEPAPAPTPLNS